MPRSSCHDERRAGRTVQSVRSIFAAIAALAAVGPLSYCAPTGARRAAVSRSTTESYARKARHQTGQWLAWVARRWNAADGLASSEPKSARMRGGERDFLLNFGRYTQGDVLPWLTKMT